MKLSAHTAGASAKCRYDYRVGLLPRGASSRLARDRRTDQCNLRRNPVAAPLLVQLRERIASETISQLHNPGNPFVWRPAVQGFGEGHTGRAANLECVASSKEGIAPMASKPDDAKSGLR